jgi:hypothetical protein
MKEILIKQIMKLEIEKKVFKDRKLPNKISQII